MLFWTTFHHPNTIEIPQQQQDVKSCSQPATHLAVFAYGQTSKVTQQTTQVLFKQTGISQVLSRQVHKLVGVHHLAWAGE